MAFIAQRRINNYVCEYPHDCTEGGRFRFYSPSYNSEHWTCAPHVDWGISQGWHMKGVEMEGHGYTQNPDVLRNHGFDNYIIDIFTSYYNNPSAASVHFGSPEGPALDEKIEQLASGEPMPAKKKLPKVQGVEVGSAPLASPPPTPEIKFTVTRNSATNYTWEPKAEIIKIPVRLICASLENKEHAKQAEQSRINWDGDSLLGLMRRHDLEISPAEWAKAIAKAHARVASVKPTATESSIFADVETGYMAMGNLLYEIRPTGIVNTNKALMTMRKNASTKIKAEVELIRVAAEAEAAKKRQQVDKYVSEQYARAAEAEQKLVKLKKECANLAPQWPLDNGLPIKKYNSIWHVGFYVMLELEKFEYKASGLDTSNIRTWAADQGKPYTYMVWAPIGPGFSPTNLRLDSGCCNLPHLSQQKGCMGLGDAPAKIESVHDIYALSNSLNRAFRTVTLNSMLPEGFPNYWDDRFWAYVPTKLKKALKTTRWLEAVSTLDLPTPGEPPVTPPQSPVLTNETVEAPRPGEVTRTVINHDDDRRETWSI